MVELRRATREVPGAGGAVLLGRGYDVRVADGLVRPGTRLEPDAFPGIALAEVTAATADERQALRTAAFGVGRTLTLRREGGGLAVLAADGQVRAGWVDEAVADAVATLLAHDPRLEAWVCWEWLQADGRVGLQVALSRPELAPQRLAPPPARGLSGRALLGDRRVWLALGALVVIAVVVFAVWR
jgi:hypothetical protein